MSRGDLDREYLALRRNLDRMVSAREFGRAPIERCHKVARASGHDPGLAKAVRPIGIDRGSPTDRPWTAKRRRARRLACEGELLGCVQVLVQSDYFGGMRIAPSRRRFCPLK